jgi:hypothetical protein
MFFLRAGMNNFKNSTKYNQIKMTGMNMIFKYLGAMIDQLEQQLMTNAETLLTKTNSIQRN